MGKHTPGPWEILDFGQGEGPIIHSQKPATPIAATFGTKRERIHNARLIAAAPDLLAACKQAIKVTGGSEAWNGSTRDFLKKIEEAIASAERAG